jgi:small subunit ribosomal protein S16
MLTIRLNRIGKKNKPYFRIVLQEHTLAPGGRHIEVLGSYNPHSKEIVLKGERIKYWVSQGVQTSDTAYNLLVKNGILSGEKRKVKVPEKVKKEESKTEAVAVSEKKEEVAAEVKEEKIPEAKIEEVKPEEVKEEKKEEAKEAPKDEAPVA